MMDLTNIKLTLMKQLIIVMSLLFTSTGSELFSQTTSEFFSKADSFFSAYVSNGAVDYQAITENPSSLDEALSLAKYINVSTSEGNTYQAFWINAYNLAVIKGIVEHYPIKSPLDKKGFFDKIKYELGGTTITLNDIENKKLRAKFDEPRFHFVLVCGAKGCPPIIAKAYTPANIETLLQTQTMKALNDPQFIQVKGNKVAFSEIFKWYKEDFVQNGNEIDFLNTYRKEPVPANAKVTYYSYDWRLNSK